VRHLDDLDDDNVSDVTIEGDVMHMSVHGGDASTWTRLREQ
jgi:hypothetical protein